MLFTKSCVNFPFIRCYLNTYISIFLQEVNECPFEHCSQCPVDQKGCKTICKLIRNFNLFCIFYNKGASCVSPNQPKNKFFLKVEFKKQGLKKYNFKILFT
jgi:hypothetical protein